MLHAIAAVIIASVLPLLQTPATMPANSEDVPAAARAAAEHFREAVRKGAWQDAIRICSSEVQSRAWHSPPESFLRKIVPVERLAASTELEPCGSQKSGEIWGRVSFCLDLFEPGQKPRLQWEMGVVNEDGVWRVALPREPLLKFLEAESARVAGEGKELARQQALEPKLKGVHTRLTSLHKQYALGQYMSFRLELINDGPAELLYDDSAVRVNASMLIKDASGDMISYNGPNVHTAVSATPIEPGQTVVLFDNWNLGPYRIEKPGRYTVQFRGYGLMIGDRKKSSSTGWGVWYHTVSKRKFPSNVVEIEVVAPRTE